MGQTLRNVVEEYPQLHAGPLGGCILDPKTLGSNARYCRVERHLNNSGILVCPGQSWTTHPTSIILKPGNHTTRHSTVPTTSFHVWAILNSTALEAQHVSSAAAAAHVFPCLFVLLSAVLSTSKKHIEKQKRL